MELIEVAPIWILIGIVNWSYYMIKNKAITVADIFARLPAFIVTGPFFWLACLIEYIRENWDKRVI